MTEREHTVAMLFEVARNCEYITALSTALNGKLSQIWKVKMNQLVASCTGFGALIDKLPDNDKQYDKNAAIFSVNISLRGFSVTELEALNKELKERLSIKFDDTIQETAKI
jgi:hypothetical protein